MLADRVPAEVVCHGDFAPCNCVFDDEEALALIDFDAAHTGPRLADIAYAVYRFAPLTAPANHDGFGSREQQAERLRLFCDSYGLTDRTGLIAAVIDRLRDLVAFMRAEAAAGHSGFAAHIAAGHDELYLRDLAYLGANGDFFTAHLQP